MSTPTTTPMPVWPGPRVLVPMATDIFLIGSPDLNTELESTINNYYSLYLEPGAILPAPFTKGTLGVGAHIMWTLPYSLRQGAQTETDTEVGFPLVPNRWLITRFEYPADADGNQEAGGPVPPKVTATIVRSDETFSIANDPSPQDYSQYPYPDAAHADFPISGLGGSSSLASYTGENITNPPPPQIRAVGPGSVSWSVAYDNVRNVFSLYDTFGNNAAKSAMYTYSIMGWYADPDDDVLSDLPTDDPAKWMNAIESGFKWSLGPSVANVQTAEADWLAWQKQHGLDKDPIDPTGLTSQEQAAIQAWADWNKKNGAAGPKPDLPTKLLCHSMVATVKWQGSAHAYQSGAPGSGLKFPDIAIGNTSVESISTYMANKVASELKDEKWTLEIERAMTAFQKDLLFDLAKNRVNSVETSLHTDEFELSNGGQVWVVVRPESTTSEIQETGGQQTIPLSIDNTKALTALNKQQEQLNNLNGTISSLRAELFMLYIKNGQLGRHSPTDLKTKVTNSIKAITTELTSQLSDATSLSGQIDTAAKALATAVTDKFVVKAVDLLANSAPTDPVVMFAGADLDNKLTAPGQYDENEMLFVRFTGQTVTGLEITYTPDGGSPKPTETIGAADMLAPSSDCPSASDTKKICLPDWNAIPKEAMSIWIETLLLDTSNAEFIAQAYFEKIGEPNPPPSDLEALTAQVKKQQTVLWNDAETLGLHEKALGQLVGIVGVYPSREGVAFRSQQPWTPIYMDWQVTWFPSSDKPDGAFDNWTLGDIDYEFTGTTIASSELSFQGRSVLNAKAAQNIVGKFQTFEIDPNYEKLNVPLYIIDSLRQAANDVKNLDILTQSLGGLTDQIVNKVISMNFYPTAKGVGDLLGNTDNLMQPLPGSQNATSAMPFFPIRSGHFQVTQLNIVDAFGQIWRGKDPTLPNNTPMEGILWSESLTTPPSITKASTYGQLAPRLNQAAQPRLEFLQKNDDTVKSNSSDLTSPICGYVMPNHLDNSLMVFDADGNNQGAILKIQRESNDSGPSNNYSIRWEAVPGGNTQLGAQPRLVNDHLQGFVLGLLATAGAGATAYDEFMSSIDSTLWTMGNFPDQSGNLSILLGRPLAVVRAKLSLPLAGMPLYNQTWSMTGEYYDDKGGYKPTNPDYTSVPFNVRLGDSAVENNGVMGYFQNDDYSTFNSVYGSHMTTSQLRNALYAKRDEKLDLSTVLAQMEQPVESQSGYVVEGHLIETPLYTTSPVENKPVLLTMLVDPAGVIPVISGSQPASKESLPNGPVSTALNNFVSTFRAGPLLLDPDKIRMPEPAQVNGNWGWVARKDVTTWNPDEPITQYTPVGTLESKIPRLIEGWVTLSSAESNDNQQP